MQFTSRLVIIASNTDPRYMADSAGGSKDAIADRLYGTRALSTKGTWHIPSSHARVELESRLIRALVHISYCCGHNVAGSDIAFAVIPFVSNQINI